MKKVLLAVAMVFMATTAHAACGPSITFDIDQNDYRSSGIYHDDSEIKAGLQIKWNLGEDYCEEQEFADWMKKKADTEKQDAEAERVRLQNLDRQLRLCKTYGADNPLLKGQCG